MSGTTPREDFARLIKDCAGAVAEPTATLASGSFGISSDIEGKNDTQDAEDELSLYPNPAQQMLNIKLTASQLVPNTVIEIYNISGARVKHVITQNFNTEGGIYPLDINHFAAGVYMVYLHNGNKIFKQKFAVVK